MRDMRHLPIDHLSEQELEDNPWVEIGGRHWSDTRLVEMLSPPPRVKLFWWEWCLYGVVVLLFVLDLLKAGV